ncbi:MAG: hypothetical protein ACR2MN_13710 [Acidimicrobiales bacterium]
MSYFRPDDHAMGLELQLEELTEQRERARVQHRYEELRRLDAEIVVLQTDLVETAERLAFRGVPPEPEPILHNAEELGAEG